MIQETLQIDLIQLENLKTKEGRVYSAARIVSTETSLSQLASQVIGPGMALYMSKLNQTEGCDPRDNRQTRFRYDRKTRRNNQSHQPGHFQRARSMCHIPDTQQHSQDQYDKQFQKCYSIDGRSRRRGAQKETKYRLENQISQQADKPLSPSASGNEHGGRSYQKAAESCNSVNMWRVIALSKKNRSADKDKNNHRDCEQEPPSDTKARLNLLSNRAVISYIHAFALYRLSW
jgi:hypothetical protein